MRVRDGEDEKEREEGEEGCNCTAHRNEHGAAEGEGQAPLPGREFGTLGILLKPLGESKG
jgi:hypothetical protein